MVKLISIPGVGQTSSELLEAAGFHDAEAVAMAGEAELVRELERANSILKIAKRTPRQNVIGKWIVAARVLVGVPEKSPDPVLMPVNYEHSPQVAAMLVNAPFAIPLPVRVLLDNQLGVAAIPAAILLNRYSGDLDVKVTQRLPVSQQSKGAVPTNGYLRMAGHNSPRLDIDTSRIRSMEHMGDTMPKIVAAKTAPDDDRITLLRTPLPTTNKGRDPQSRWYIRGVLHNTPYAIYLGAVITLVTIIMIPVSVVAATLLLLSAEMPESYAWVPGWWLVFPVLLPLLGIFYLIVGVGGKCRVCNQRLFVHRPHLKNSRAHHMRGLGYILPLCAHIIVFRWFRCTHCGTPVRLKK